MAQSLPAAEIYTAAGERARLQAGYRELADLSRTPSTSRGLANHGLKLLWLLASRGHPLLPSQQAVTDYLTFISLERRNVGAASNAWGAPLNLCRVSAWADGLYRAGAPLAPLPAMHRICRHTQKKSVGLTLAIVRAFPDCYAWARPSRAAAHQLELAFGCAIVIAYKILARYADLFQLRWGASHCHVDHDHVSFWLETRKTHQEGGGFLDVARPPGPRERGAYHAILEARAAAGGTGYVLPATDASGRVNHHTPMSYAAYVRILRHSLTQLGVDPAHAMTFAGQSPRAGGATEAARARVRPEGIALLAGVKDINSILTYNRADIGDRLEASRTLGL